MDNERDIALVQAGIDACVEYWGHDNAGPNLDAAAIAATVPEQAARSAPADENAQMLALANFITSSAHPEDPRLEVAYAIARYLKLDWPAAYDSAPAGGGEAVKDQMLWDVFWRQDVEVLRTGAIVNLTEGLRAVYDLAAKRAQQPAPDGEAVGEIGEYGPVWFHQQINKLPVGTKVYTRPAPDGEAVVVSEASAVRKIMARLARMLDEDQFAHIEQIALSAGIEPPAPVNQLVEALEECESRLSLLIAADRHKLLDVIARNKARAALAAAGKE